ncbi:hypothetical protein BMETH_2535292374226, partial [methanotrophic bacterial endosymbiont of Bathymodiolus sp.]
MCIPGRYKKNTFTVAPDEARPVLLLEF